MLSFDDFIRSPRCKPLVLKDEDEPQDRVEGMRLLRKDQREQYDAYVRQFEGGDDLVTPDHGRRLPEKKPGSSSPSLHKALHNMENGLRNTKWNEYMQKYRSRPVVCPKCGHEFRELKRKKKNE